MKKTHKLLCLIPVVCLLIFEILPYNVLIVSQFPIYDNSGEFIFMQTEKEYYSYFDIAVLGRGNIFALATGIFTAAACLCAVIYVITGRHGLIKAALVLNSCAIVGELLQTVILFGGDLIMDHATKTGLLLTSLTCFLCMYGRKNEAYEGADQISQKGESL